MKILLNNRGAAAPGKAGPAKDSADYSPRRAAGATGLRMKQPSIAADLIGLDGYQGLDSNKRRLQAD
jgi:hypothetical protein